MRSGAGFGTCWRSTHAGDTFCPGPKGSPLRGGVHPADVSAPGPPPVLPGAGSGGSGGRADHHRRGRGT